MPFTYITMATTSSPRNLTFGDRCLMSSVIPRIYMRSPPMVMEIIFGSKLRNMSMLTVLPAKMARPPNLGMAFVCILLLSFGISIAPTFGANLMAIGVIARDKTKAVKNVTHKVLYIKL